MDINDDKYDDEYREALKDYFDAYNLEGRIVAKRKIDRVIDKMAANDPERFKEWIKKRKLNPPSEDNEFEETKQYKGISVNLDPVFDVIGNIIIVLVFFGCILFLFGG
jgi:hypothetical protein